VHVCAYVCVCFCMCRFTYFHNSRSGVCECM